METESYWTVINALLSFVESGRVDAATLKEAHLRLSNELDRRIVGNLPTEETKKLISALNGLYTKVSGYEQDESV